jgi:DNA ligase (NAD+)
MGDKSAQNVIAAIGGSRTRGLARLLNALGIRMVGERVAELLAAHFGDLERIARASEDELSQIHGIGGEIARAVRTFFADPKNRDLVRKLGEVGVTTTQEREAPVPQTLAGKVVVITGTLPSLSREAARALVVRHGGRVTSTVSRKTDYVVVGEAPGSKADDARRLGVKTIDEAELMALVGR